MKGQLDFVVIILITTGEESRKEYIEERIAIQEHRIEDYEHNRPFAVRPSIHSE